MVNKTTDGVDRRMVNGASGHLFYPMDCVRASQKERERESGN